ncbi:uridine kinase family protein [Nocardioides dongkuii]|uniref:uridine kinase family protein n=1 Tax=Nocardioides dongkuii TaxID=2760089 RepID=UPI0018784A94|nr:4-amino-4-deoxy-L-arabinose transferase [Nocardioides dongkuii]
MVTASPSETALRLALARPARLGGGRLICVDGPAGSGKSTLAAGIAALDSRAVVVTTDDLLDGWDGLPGLPALLDDLLAPLARGEDSSYLRYDWHAGRYAERVAVPRTPLLVVEGVGSGARVLADRRSLLVWVSAPADVRMRRGLARDGAAVAPHWRRWMAAEAAHFAEEGTAAAADLHVDGATHQIEPLRSQPIG